MLATGRKEKKNISWGKYQMLRAKTLSDIFSLEVCDLNILDEVQEKQAIFLLKLRSILGAGNSLFVSSD